MKCTACKCANTFISNRRVGQDEKEDEQERERQTESERKEEEKRVSNKYWKMEEKGETDFDCRSIKLAECRSTLHRVWHVSIKNGLVSYITRDLHSERKKKEKKRKDRKTQSYFRRFCNIQTIGDNLTEVGRPKSMRQSDT